MLASAALASASLPLREASITRFTAAMSASDVAAVGAIAKGPAVGRASGLKYARLWKIVPCKPTLACAKDARAPFFEAFAGGRFCGSGVAEGTDVAGIATAACWPDWIAGRGRGGNFCTSAVAVSADSTQAAINVK
jgi:hypothetical protein